MKLDETLWYQQLGYFNNPFSIKPGAFHDELVGPQEIITKVTQILSEGGVCFVIGEYGAGKTTLMKRIIGQFKGEKKVIYYSCNRKEGLIDFNSLLIGKNWFTRFFKVKSENMILLLDEVQDLNLKEQEDLVELYREKKFKSIALITKDKSDIQLSNELILLIENNFFQMRNLSLKEAINLVRSRIGPNDFFPDRIIRSIHKLSSNPRAILENCEDVCRYAIQEGAKEVDIKHFKALKK
jgi:replication-associated recombination protein RarA